MQPFAASVPAPETEVPAKPSAQTVQSATLVRPGIVLFVVKPAGHAGHVCAPAPA